MKQSFKMMVNKYANTKDRRLVGILNNSIVPKKVNATLNLSI